MGEQGHLELVDCARPNAGEPMPWSLAGHACQVFLFKNVPHGALGTLCWGPQLWVYWVIIHASGQYCKGLARTRLRHGLWASPPARSAVRSCHHGICT